MKQPASLTTNCKDMEPEVNDIFLLDRNNMVTLAMLRPKYTTDDTNLKACDDLSQRQWVKDTKTKTGAPYFFGGFERQIVYKIFITFPILDRETNERLGIKIYLDQPVLLSVW